MSPNFLRSLKDHVPEIFPPGLWLFPSVNKTSTHSSTWLHQDPTRPQSCLVPKLPVCSTSSRLLHCPPITNYTPLFGGVHSPHSSVLLCVCHSLWVAPDLVQGNIFHKTHSLEPNRYCIYMSGKTMNWKRRKGVSNFIDDWQRFSDDRARDSGHFRSLGVTISNLVFTRDCIVFVFMCLWKEDEREFIIKRFEMNLEAADRLDLRRI